MPAEKRSQKEEHGSADEIPWIFESIARTTDKFERERKRIYRYQTIPLMMMAILAMMSTLMLISVNEQGSLVKKEKLSKDLLTAIQNGADLRTVRQIYNNRSKENLGIKALFINTEDAYYRTDTPLSIVLEDLRASLFLTGKSNKTSLLQQLDNIAFEHTKLNPFDKLDPRQKDYFQNISVKLSDSYALIQPEVNRIADELYNKNLLVTEYLGTSRISFWISIAALIFSLVIALFQTYQNSTSRLRSLIMSCIHDAIAGRIEGNDPKE